MENGSLHQLHMPLILVEGSHYCRQFCQKKVPYYIRTQPLNVRPMDWMHPTKHPAIAVRENKVRLVFQDVDDDNDDGKIDFFPVRRSDRRTKSEVEAKHQQRLEERLICNNDLGLPLKIQQFSDKGRGVVATRKLLKG